MLRALPGHLVAMAVFVGVLIFGVRAIGAALPTLNRDLVVGLGAVYVAAWLGLIVITLIEAGLGRDARARWQRRNHSVLNSWLSSGPRETSQSPLSTLTMRPAWQLMPPLERK